MAGKYPENFEALIDMLKTLPGIGKRSAERMAFSIYKWDAEKTRKLGKIIAELPERVTKCPECANLAMDGNKCSICLDSKRDTSLVCVIEEASQIQNIENSGFFRGRYHILGGKITPLKGQEAHSLNTEILLKKAKEGEVKEVVLALSYDMEGQATAIYIAGILRETGVKVTRLAQGMPAGSDISYVDSATLAAAMSGRTGIGNID